VANVFYQTLGASELLPRYAFLEPLFTGRRVLELGAVAATGGRSAALLRARGAKRVTALDADPLAVDLARRAYPSDPELSFVAGRAEDVSNGPFDLVLAADAAPLVRQPSVLESVARLLSSEGYAVLALRNPAGPSLAQLVTEEPRESPPTWGELASALQSRFPSVELVTQCALAAYRLGPAGAGEVETSVDATLCEAEECAYYLAVCGQRPSGLLDVESVVVLPASPLAIAAGRRAELTDRLRLAEDERAKRDDLPDGELKRRVAELESSLEAARGNLRRLERDLETLGSVERAARERADQAERELRASRIAGA